MADISVSRDVILWRARQTLASPDPDDRAERRRASQILIAAANALLHSGPFHDGLAFAQAAHRLAPLRGDQASSLYLTGFHHMTLGAYEPARAEFTRVLELYRELGDRHGEADTRHQLARIDEATDG